MRFPKPLKTAPEQTRLSPVHDNTSSPNHKG